jgi:Kef-type K+ transport system membrane component KefB
MAESTSTSARAVARIAAFHLLILSAAIACFVGIITVGESSPAPSPTNPIVAVGEASSDVLMHFLLALLLGAALAVWMYPRLSSSDVRFTVFALFCGVAMSVTAFPVLARILTDRGLSRTRLGTLALASAAFDDGTAWCLLALVVSVARSDLRHAFHVLASTAAYIGIMLLAARPLLKYGVRFQSNARQPSREMSRVSRGTMPRPWGYS